MGESLTPEQRMARAVRGWITEAIPLGEAPIEQLYQFVADEIREAEEVARADERRKITEETTR